jgi:hypothetical protein
MKGKAIVKFQWLIVISVKGCGGEHKLPSGFALFELLKRAHSLESFMIGIYGQPILLGHEFGGVWISKRSDIFPQLYTCRPIRVFGSINLQSLPIGGSANIQLYVHFIALNHLQNAGNGRMSMLRIKSVLNMSAYLTQIPASMSCSCIVTHCVTFTPDICNHKFITGSKKVFPESPRVVSISAAAGHFENIRSGQWRIAQPWGCLSVDFVWGRGDDRWTYYLISKLLSDLINLFWHIQIRMSNVFSSRKTSCNRLSRIKIQHNRKKGFQWSAHSFNANQITWI